MGNSSNHVEDACVWRQDGAFQLVMKDMTGGICGEKHGGIHATSKDGVNWTISEPALAYSRTVKWSDGRVTTQGQLERPQVLVERGQPTHLFFATCDGPGGFQNMTRTWNLCIPLKV